MQLLLKLRYVILFFVSLGAASFLLSVATKNYELKTEQEFITVVVATVSTLSPVVAWVYEFLQKVKKEILRENDHLEKEMKVLSEEFLLLKNSQVRERLGDLEKTSNRVETKMEVLYSLFEEVLSELIKETKKS